MKTRTRRLMMLIAAALLLVGCSEDSSRAAAPVAREPTREDIGHYCNMIVVDHAGPKAQIFLEHRSEPIWFSSVRDAFAFTMLDEEPKNVTAIWVNDADVITWAHPEPGTWTARIVAPDATCPTVGPRFGWVGSIRHGRIRAHVDATPRTAARDTPVTVVAWLEDPGPYRATGLTVHAEVLSRGDRVAIELTDDGLDTDPEAGDGYYTGLFNPQAAPLLPGVGLAGFAVARQLHREDHAVLAHVRDVGMLAETIG